MDQANLRAEKNSAKSAFLQYVTGKGREGFASYAFVEDVDDIIFYSHVLQSFDDICYLPCGGKSEVISVFNKLAAEHETNGLLFFVDRDTENAPFSNPEICRTNTYSWENHLLHPDVVRILFRRKLLPTPAPWTVNTLVEAWRGTLAHFEGALIHQLDLISAANDNGEESQCSSLVLVQNAIADGDTLKPHDDVINTLTEKHDRLEMLGIDITRTGGRSPEETSVFARGKTIYQVFAKFVDHLCSAHGKQKLIAFESAKLTVPAMPFTHESVEYLKEYCRVRLG